MSAVLREGGQDSSHLREGGLGGRPSLADCLSGSGSDAGLVDFACCSHARDGASRPTFHIRTQGLDTQKD